MKNYLKDFIKHVKDVFGCGFVKNPTTENAMKGIFINTLTKKDSSFAVIAVRCNSETSTGKRKMTPKLTYLLLQEYEISENGITISSERQKNNTLYDDYYTENINGIPHIQISAVVGQNGSGKSSIIEFIMRLINNFAAATIGELQNSGQAAEHLHFIDGIDGELWYILEGNAYHMTVKNCSVKLFKFSNKTNNSGNIHFSAERKIFDNNKNDTCTTLVGLHTSLGDNDLKILYQCFFYTLISNQSIYAYNTLDFVDECNTDKKEALAHGKSEDTKFDTEDKCWLHGLFHKNDAYRTPLVITPFRKEGNIDINNERELAVERLVRLYSLHENLRTINDHLLVESLIYSYSSESKYGIEQIKRRLGFKYLTEKGYDILKNDIVTKWSKKLNKNLFNNRKPYHKEAIEYLVYKTLKVSYQYKEHRDFYESACMMTDAYNGDTLDELIEALAKDHSHITRKIYQTIGFLIFDIFELGEPLNENVRIRENENTISFKQLGNRWFAATKLSAEEMKIPVWVHIRMQAIVPPPFFLYE